MWAVVTFHSCISLPRRTCSWLYVSSPSAFRNLSSVLFAPSLSTLSDRNPHHPGLSSYLRFSSSGCFVCERTPYPSLFTKLASNIHLVLAAHYLVPPGSTKLEHDPPSVDLSTLLSGDHPRSRIFFHPHSNHDPKYLSFFHRSSPSPSLHTLAPFSPYPTALLTTGCELRQPFPFSHIHLVSNNYSFPEAFIKPSGSPKCQFLLSPRPLLLDLAS